MRIVNTLARGATRSFRSSARSNDKVVIALYDDPVTGYPPANLRDGLPVVEGYADGQTLPTLKSAQDFKDGDLLGSVSGELGLRKFLEDRGSSPFLLWFSASFWWHTKKDGNAGAFCTRRVPRCSSLKARIGGSGSVLF